jgi:dihydroorotate dehydrogenase (NAD+) catalytic subunit
MSVPAARLEAEMPANGSPSYRIWESFETNRALGPAYHGPWPDVPETPMTDFLGIPVRSTFGVAPSILIDSRWVESYSQLGFDLLALKSVRSVERICQPPPNWLPAAADMLADLPDADLPQEAVDDRPRNPARATMVGSFGIPSIDPEDWVPEIAASRALLADGQAFIVSIAGTVLPGSTESDLIADFGRLAAMVREAGAQVVEINLSCPNVPGREGAVYRDPELCGQIAAAVRKGAKHLPVIVKTGHVGGDDGLQALLEDIAPHVQGLVCINALSRWVINEAGDPAFGAGRERAGVMGDAIRPFALDMIRRAAAIRDREKLDLALMGVGGVSAPEHIEEFREAGASAVFSASAAMWNPHLAIQLKAAGVLG